MKVVLASASPRRKELLTQIGWEFSVCVSEVEEVITKKLPAEVVEELSQQKAEAVASLWKANEKEQEESVLVIGADTVVSCEEQILGKPANKADAVRMLSMLEGKSHQVYTGVTLILLQKGKERLRRTFHEETRVTFYSMTEEEIFSYVESKEPEGKAGSYAIQGLCARFIRGIEGDYNNVVGLPVGRVYQEVHKMIREIKD